MKPAIAEFTRGDVLPTPVAARARAGLCRWIGRLFPLLLWAFGTLYFGGDLGKWSDDYTNARRNPATGASTLSLHWTYPRPLGHNFVPAKATLLWDHDRLNHIIGACIHGGVVLLLWALLSVLTRSRMVAAAGALLYLVFPLNVEVVFWLSGTHVGLSTATFLLLALLYLHFARGAHGLWAVPFMILLAYAIPCWWEPPAAGIVALPLLYWAAASPQERLRTSVIRAIAPAAGCALACWVYMKQVQAAVLPSDRGGRESVVALWELGQRVRELWPQVRFELLGQGATLFMKGAFWHGIRTMAGWGSIIWGLLLAGSLWAWCRYACAVPASRRSPTAATRPLRRGFVMAFGLALFLLAWLPIALIRSQGLSPRMFYFPLVGVILFLAALLDGLLSILPVGHGKIPVRGPQPPKERGWGAPTALGAGLGLVCIAGAVGQVGTQSALRHRYALDQQEMARLKEMIPQPCTEAVLMPMDIQNMAAATGYLVFDNFATGGFAAGWSAVAMVQHSYQRNDVFATSCLYDDPLPLSDFSARGAHCAYPLASFELLPAGGCIILLSRMYPFSVDVNGQVNLVDELIIDRIGEAAVRLPVPQTHALVAAQKLSAKAIWVQESSPAVGLESLTDWQWAATGEHVPFLNRVEWGTTLPATLLRGTSPQSNRRSGVKTVLPASLSDLDLFFRVTLKEADVRQGIGDDAAVLFYLGSAPGPPNAKYRVWGGPQSPQTRLELRRDLIRNDRHWLACTIRVPAHSELLELHAEAQVLSNAPRSCGICLTPGHFKIGSHEDTPPPSRN